MCLSPVYTGNQSAARLYSVQCTVHRQLGRLYSVHSVQCTVYMQLGRRVSIIPQVSSTEGTYIQARRRLDSDKLFSWQVDGVGRLLSTVEVPLGT